MIYVGDTIKFSFPNETLVYKVKNNSEGQYYLVLEDRSYFKDNDLVFIKLGLDKNIFCNTGLPYGVFPYRSSLEELQITIDRLQEEIKKKYGTSKSNPGIKYYNSYRADWIWYEETFIDRPKKKEEIINNKIRLNELSRKIAKRSESIRKRRTSVSSTRSKIRI